MARTFRITSIDHAPEDLYAQVPFSARLLRQIAGPDRPDYWLAELLSPLSWMDAGTLRSISHLALCARFIGQTITVGLNDLVVGIAYIIDPTVLTDERLDFSKCRYVAIGIADAAP